MGILDRYILKQYLRSFLFVLILFSAAILLIDFTGKHGELIRQGVSAHEIIRYYGAYTLFVINFIAPITVFITTVFVTTRLAQQTEIIAILSSGVNYSRLFVPYMVGAVLIAASNFYLVGWGLPLANVGRIAFEDSYNFNDMYPRSPAHLHVKVGPEEYLYVGNYRSTSNSGEYVVLERVCDFQLRERLSAQKMAWLPDRRVWRLEQWQRRSIEEGVERIAAGDFLELPINILPTDFSINPRLYETLTLPVLNKHIQSLQAKGQGSAHLFVVEKYARYMTPFSALILTFLGVVVAARKSREGVGFQLTIGFVCTFIYIASTLFARGFAEAKSAYPLLTIWLPNIIFGLVGAVLYRSLPR